MGQWHTESGVRRLSLILLSLAVACGADSPAWGAAPLITGMAPLQGAAGQPIRLDGENLLGTRAVFFVVGRDMKRAVFRVISAKQVDVTAPDFYRSGADAILVLLTRDGVTVACPASDEVVSVERSHSRGEILHVLREGLVHNARPTVAVVEAGGIVQSISNATLVFVKAGGIVARTDSIGAVFQESGASVGTGPSSSSRGTIHFPIAAIRVSESIGPFRYANAPPALANAAPSGPPRVTQIAPLIATPGDIVTIRGSGFMGTTDVLIPSGNHAVSTGFRVMSDRELTFEVPTVQHAPTAVIVINRRGLTIAVPRSPIMNPRTGAVFMLTRVTQGEIYNSPSGSRLLLIEKGGVVVQGGSVYLVKKGGGLAAPRLRGQAFYEPEASVSQDWTSGGRGHGREVPEIHVSEIPAFFEVTAPTPVSVQLQGAVQGNATSGATGTGSLPRQTTRRSTAHGAWHWSGSAATNTPAVPQQQPEPQPAPSIHRPRGDPQKLVIPARRDVTSRVSD